MAILKIGTGTHIAEQMILIRASAQRGDKGGKEGLQRCVYGQRRSSF